MMARVTYRIVGVRADRSKRVLCDGLSSGDLAERIAGHLSDDGPFTSISVERDDVPIVEQAVPQDGQLNF
jgi:hypothetical protein